MVYTVRRQPPVRRRLWNNKCWPKLLAPNDPGFTLLAGPLVQHTFAEP